MAAGASSWNNVARIITSTIGRTTAATRYHRSPNLSARYIANPLCVVRVRHGTYYLNIVQITDPLAGLLADEGLDRLNR